MSKLGTRSSTIERRYVARMLAQTLVGDLANASGWIYTPDGGEHDIDHINESTRVRREKAVRYWIAKLINAGKDPSQ